MIEAGNLRQSGIYLTVDLPDGTEVDLTRAIADGWTTLAQHIIDRVWHDDMIVGLTETDQPGVSVYVADVVKEPEVKEQVSA